MAHQQNYSSVPPSQQQQQQPTGQPNHNQQPPGAGPQRHHQNYPTYATQTAQTRPQQPGAGSHPNQQGQRILQQYSQQGNNPQAHTQNYIPGVSLGFIVLIILFVTKFLSLVTDAYNIKFYISSIHKDSRAMVYSTLLNLRHDPLVLQRQHTTMFLQERSRL